MMANSRLVANSTVSVSNFGNATWAAEQRAIYDATKEGAHSSTFLHNVAHSL